MKHGATNTYAFAIQPGATPSRTGDLFSREETVRMGAVHSNDIIKITDLWINQVEGSIITWLYDSFDISPEIWVVRNSSGVVSYVWEAESKFHPDRNSAQPFINITSRRSSLIPSGGSIVQLLYPDQTALDSIETLVNTASLPSWITDTRFSGASTTAILLEQLFRTAQNNANLTVHGDITTALQYQNPSNIMRQYIHLWLRQAAKILYNYSGESMIELITTQFTVDSDGVVSI